MERRTYKDFSLGVQENTQEYLGGLYSGADLDLNSLFGVIRPSSAKSDSYTDDDNLRYQVDTFTADGTWTCPAGVTSAQVECWGAGGGGTTNTGGGGGGAYSRSTVTVVPTTGYAIQVGVGAANTTGEDSTFNSTTVVAKGGSTGATGTGGQASSGTGDTKYDGGNGSTGTGNRGGGGGAGDTGNGSNASAGTGGNGGTTNGGLGSFGTTGQKSGPGGGGSSTAAAQVAGKDGEVRVTYLVDAGQGYPVIKKRAWNREVAGGTSHAITLPTGILAGEILMIVFSATSNPTCSIADTSWTKLGQQSESVNMTQAIFYKVATGSDTATVTTSSSVASSHTSFRISGASVPTATFATGSSTNANPPSHTSGSGTANRLWMAAASINSGSLTVTAGPSGYTDFITISPGAAAGAWTGTATSLTTNATENPGTFTNSSTSWVASTIAFEFDASSSVGTNTIIDMEGYNENDTYDIYALINSGSAGSIIARDADAETWSTVNYLTKNPVGGMTTYITKMFWGTTTGLGSYDGTTFTEEAYTLQTTQDSGLYMPMVVFSGNLYVGNMRYVGKLDPTPTWDPDALVLPAGFKIIDMRVWNDRLAILAQRTGSSVEVRVFFWDGTSATYDDVAQLNDARPMAMYTYLGALLVFGINGNIYQYRGTAADGVQDFEIVRRVPGEIVIKNPSGILMSGGEVLFGVQGTSSNALGIWALGRQPGSQSVILYPKHIPKGDYKYDPGTSDYYSVTSLLNVRVNDSQFNPSETGTPATWSSDSTAGDSTWTKITELTAGDFGIGSIACDTDGSVVVMGNDVSYLSTDSGVTFSTKSYNAEGGIAVDSDGSVIAIAHGSGGNIYVSTDSGANFTSRGTSRSYYTIQCDDDGSVMVATYQSTSVDYSTNSGTAWTTVAVGGSGVVNDVCMRDTGATMYAGCTGSGVGAVRKSTNTGTSWANSGDASMDDITKVSCSSDGTKVVAASPTDNALWYSSNSGSTWAQLTGLPSGIDVDTCSISADGTKIIVGTQRGDNGLSAVYYSDDTGSNWSWIGQASFSGTSNLSPKGLCMSRDGSSAYVAKDNNSDNKTFWKISPVGTSLDSDDNVYAYTGSKETALTSFYLKGLNPSFSVDNGKTITGISATVSMKKATGTTAKDVTVKLVKAGTIVGDNKGADTDRSTTESEYTYGSSTDLWGTTWTPAEVNATDFGIVIQAKNTAAVMAIDTVVLKVYWEPDTTAVTQREFVYAAVQRGNATEVSETMVTGIIDLTAEGFSTGRFFTSGDDLGYPDHDKIIQGISINCPRPLNGSETITVYQTSDDTDYRQLKDITWTQIAQFTAGTDQQTRFITPFSCRRLNLQFVITPNDGTPETPPGIISYTIHFRPIGPFLTQK